MPLPDPSISWWTTLSAVGAIAVLAFLLSWVFTDLLHAPRAVYLAILMAGTGAATYGYLAWSGTDAMDFVSGYWAWGLLGAVISGGLTARAIVAAANRRGLPRPSPRVPLRTAGSLAWEGLLYGAAEGMLLSTLPTLAAWQTFQRLDWTGGAAGAALSGALAVVASALVIWVHHLGYREFRRGPQILFPIAACGLLSVAYLVTRSPIAPVGGHFLMHAGADRRGISLPPYSALAQDRETSPQLRAA